MKRVGFIGWRGMVGSVLIQRMIEENNFDNIEPVFFTTSNSNGLGPFIGKTQFLLKDAYNFDELTSLEILISCQGNEYTSKVYPTLRGLGWKGYWIDAASTLRMRPDSAIVLDPVNYKTINRKLASGVKNYIGGNCTVSLMLMAIAGLFEVGLIEWISVMTYQAASGAGSKSMRELICQMGENYNTVQKEINHPSSSILEIDRKIIKVMRSNAYPTCNFSIPLAGNLIPWIDTQVLKGQSKEEWKSQAEVNKILGYPKKTVYIDGICTRIGTMRCHSQALTIKLKKNASLSSIEDLISTHNSWVKLIPNERETTIRHLNPLNVTGSLSIAIGRLRKLNMGPRFLGAFTVGDQLLWGAAEPLRRMLDILLRY